MRRAVIPWMTLALTPLRLHATCHRGCLQQALKQTLLFTTQRWQVCAKILMKMICFDETYALVWKSLHSHSSALTPPPGILATKDPSRKTKYRYHFACLSSASRRITLVLQLRRSRPQERNNAVHYTRHGCRCNARARVKFVT